MITQEDRLSRQLTILHPRMTELQVLVAGCGMSGGWAAHGLARAVGDVALFDGADKVEEVNCGNQPFSEMNLSVGKADALVDNLAGFSTTAYPFKFPSNRTFARPDVVISCVDSFKSKQSITQWCMDNEVPMLETRAQGETAVLCFVPVERLEEHLAALPTDREVEDVGCGATGGAFLGMWIGSQVVAWLNNWCRNMTLPRMLIYHVGLNEKISTQFWGNEEGFEGDMNTTE